MDKQYIDDRIESMLISKIAHYRLQVREKYRLRHVQNGIGDTITDKENRMLSLGFAIRQLKVWLTIAKLVDKAKYPMDIHKNIIPYPTYMAKKLTSE